MTREEAIEMLNYIKQIGDGESSYKNDAQSIAIDMAISALTGNKGDLISRQAVLDIWHTRYSDIRVENEEIQYKKIAFELPSADIMECARAIKEYCEKYDEHCVGCPFNSAKPTLWCALGGSSLPHEWDLPEGEKGGDV